MFCAFDPRPTIDDMSCILERTRGAVTGRLKRLSLVKETPVVAETVDRRRAVYRTPTLAELVPLASLDQRK